MRNYIESLIKKIIDQDFFGVAAEMAFWFILGLFPFLLFLTALFGWIGKHSFMNPIFIFLKNIVPSDALNVINTEIADDYQKGSESENDKE